jgi:hypothetical protein
LKVSPFKRGGFFSPSFLKTTPLNRFCFFGIAISISSFFAGCTEEQSESDLTVLNVSIGQVVLDITQEENPGVPNNAPILIEFNRPVNAASIKTALVLLKASVEPISFSLVLLNENRLVSITPTNLLENNTIYEINISSSLTSQTGENFVPVAFKFKTQPGELSLTLIKFGDETVGSDRVSNVPLNVMASLQFNRALNPTSINPANIMVQAKAQFFPIAATLTNNNTTLLITTEQNLLNFGKFELVLSKNVVGASGETFPGYAQTFYTTSDSPPKFPVISDEELLTKVQQQTFRYFYDFAHPASGMARERNTSGDLVTSGGSGFGIMSLIVGMERGFITRAQGLTRLDKILDFLETCDRFQGAWPHWINGNTGKTIPFSANDNGADLVETSFLVQGLLTMRQYLNTALAEEQQLVHRINTLWQTVEWDWFTRGGQNVLYWHWSPDKAWAMNMTISGYNESLITYVLAAASPTHTISQTVYTNGWARNGAIVNNKLFYNIKLPLGYDLGGPLFFSHYSFLGLDPSNLSDTYANYWEQNVHHSRINRAYCIANPKNFVGYSGQNWGLTASDNHLGYSAHSPTNDLGVISPTAALSSMPYTPAESLDALRFFYYTMGDRLWGEYGFYDAFNVTEGWIASSYLAIDQGPIIVMIENHRTGLLWNLFMSAPEVQTGLTRLGFTY